MSPECQTHHTPMAVVCDEPACGSCYEDWLAVEPVPKGTVEWPREAVEGYFAGHLAHGNLDEFRSKGFIV